MLKIMGKKVFTILSRFFLKIIKFSKPVDIPCEYIAFHNDIVVLLRRQV